MRLKTQLILLLALLPIYLWGVEYPSHAYQRQYIGDGMGMYSTHTDRSAHQDFNRTYPQLTYGYTGANGGGNPLTPTDGYGMPDGGFSPFDGEFTSGGGLYAVDNKGGGSPDETWTFNGVTYGRDADGTFYMFNTSSGKWRKMNHVNPGEIGYSYSPIGDALLPLLLMAMLAALGIYRRQRRMQTAE